MSKVIVATYTTCHHFKVPEEWDIKDVEVRWGILYYKGKEVTCPSFTFEADKHPDTLEEDDTSPLLDTDEEDEEENK